MMIRKKGSAYVSTFVFLHKVTLGVEKGRPLKIPTTQEFHAGVFRDTQYFFSGKNKSRSTIPEPTKCEKK